MADYLAVGILIPEFFQFLAAQAEQHLLGALPAAIALVPHFPLIQHAGVETRHGEIHHVLRGLARVEHLGHGGHGGNVLLQLGLSGKLLLLRQDLLKLDLYGTIRGAVSTFDTFNHIPDLDTAIANAGFFMEKGGVFLFDMNTPYKHKNVLGENTFTFEEEDACCVWKNHYNAADRRVEISVDIDYRETGEHFHEAFSEYTYDLDTIRTVLEKHGFVLESVCDGETFGPLTEKSERYFFCAVKQHTQLEED